MADGPAGFTRDYTCPALLRMLVGFMRLRVPDYHRLWCDFPDTSARISLAMSQSYNPTPAETGVVWAAPRSLATTGGITFCFLFLLVLRCFSSQRSPHYLVVMVSRQDTGLPHSDILGSRVACTSPKLFAACDVLHRLPEPRHPPYALNCFRRHATQCCAAYTLEFRFALTCMSPVLSVPDTLESRNSSLLVLLFHNVNDRLQRLLPVSGKRDSNSRPQPWQGCALPTELFPHIHHGGERLS